MSGLAQRVCAMCDFGMVPVLGTSPTRWRCTNEKCERARPPELAGTKYNAEAEAARIIITPSEARAESRLPAMRTPSGLIIPGGRK